MLKNTSTIFRTHLRKWGTSSGVIIPRPIMKEIDIEEKDIVEITIKKIQQHNKKFRCLLCCYEFEGNQVSDNNCLYCPCCDNEDTNAFEEVIINENIE
jgi:hypothetical protein